MVTRRGPKINAALTGILVHSVQLFSAGVRLIHCSDAVGNLLNSAGADQGRGDAGSVVSGAALIQITPAIFPVIPPKKQFFTIIEREGQPRSDAIKLINLNLRLFTASHDSVRIDTTTSDPADFLNTMALTSHEAKQLFVGKPCKVRHTGCLSGKHPIIQ